MSVKFKVLSIGSPEHDGPAGECGILVRGEDGGHAHELVLFCPAAHTHGKKCAQDLLDAKTQPDGVTIVAGEHVPNPKISPRVVIERHVAARKSAAAAAKPRPAVAPVENPDLE